MLVLTRRVGQTLVIDDAICVTVLAVRGDRVRLGVTVPLAVRVDRAEIHARRSVSGSVSLSAAGPVPLEGG